MTPERIHIFDCWQPSCPVPLPLVAAIRELWPTIDNTTAHCVAQNAANGYGPGAASEEGGAALTLAHQFYHGPGFPQFALDLVVAAKVAAYNSPENVYGDTGTISAVLMLEHGRLGHARQGYTSFVHRAMEDAAHALYAHLHRATTPGSAATPGDEPDTGRQGEATSPERAGGAGSTPAPGAPSGVKFDSGKAPWNLLPWRAMEEVVEVLRLGSEKYTILAPDGTIIRDGAQNWRKVPDLQNRYREAAQRHLAAVHMGQDADEETGMSHLAHLICCAAFMLEDEILRYEEEDRMYDAPGPDSCEEAGCNTGEIPF